MYKNKILCIVSIFTKKNGDFIFTQNRDESYLRPTSSEVQKKEFHHQIYYGPTDKISGGTWIYYSDTYVCSILNGGYEKHKMNPPYRMSRGLVVLELLKYDCIDSFMEKVDLEGIEPFSLIMIHRFTHEKKILVWDEIKKHKEDVSCESLIVRSSSPLYTEEEKEFHKKAFENLSEINPKRIFELQDEMKLLPNDRFPTVQTTSITQIVSTNNHLKLKFCPIL